MNTSIKSAASALGRRGGKAKTNAKANAAKANGRLGGRPASVGLIGRGGYRAEVRRESDEAVANAKVKRWSVTIPTRSGNGYYDYHGFSTRKAAVAFVESQPDFCGWES